MRAAPSAITAPCDDRGVADVWDFPFRLGPDGSIASVAQGSDRDVENLLVAAVLTRPGERIQAPTFGIADPVFAGWELPALSRHVLDFGPDVDLATLTVSIIAGDRERVAIEWERRAGAGR